ncbi:MAG: BamA/TamA family outer membrane protein [Elusimicrobia bacterium]|nr:BamA/TamA family outer membrane protein [Elusimicrobiota bacterium]
MNLSLGLIRIFLIGVVVCFIPLSLLTASSEPTQIARNKNALEEIKKITQPVEEAVSKTAQTAVEEMQKTAREAHALGGKFLQGLINIMIAASPGKTRVYLPAPSSDPNSGVTIGVLPVFLIVDPREEIRHIMAPSLTYNKIFGVNSVMRYYWYPKPGAQFLLYGAYAWETNRRFTFRYEDPRFLWDWFYFKCDLTIQRDGSYRFYGVGPRSPFEKQSNYTLKNSHLLLYTGINLWETFRLTLFNRLRSVDVLNGPIRSLPKITDFTPRPLGVEDPQNVLAQRVSLSYDSRNLVMAPSQGHFIQLFTEKAGHSGGDVSNNRSGFEFRGFYPYNRGTYVTGIRFLVEGEDGSRTPFYEQSLLGGKDSLRGFGDSRFMDRNKMTYSLEERIRLYTLKAFNVNVEFELTPFYEAGMVFHDLDDTRGSDLHHVAGLGFRTIVKPNVVGVIDLGFSEEGTALFVGIDYPF